MRSCSAGSSATCGFQRWCRATRRPRSPLLASPSVWLALALSPGRMVDVGVVADITGDAAKPVVLNLQLSAAVPAPQQSDENSATVAHRTRHHGAFHVGVPRDGPLVALVLLPRDVAVMMIANQHLPLIAPAGHAAGDHLAPFLELDPRAAATEDVGPSINRN